jgi:hypothetical protein
LPADVEFDWQDDLEKMLEDRDRKRLALRHLDGNDLGAFFGQAAGEDAPRDLAGFLAKNRDMAELSRSIGEANQASFRLGLAAAAQADPDRAKSERVYRTPFRPLVMGGDDLTALVRADLAFDFVGAFVAAYEAFTKEKLGRPLSLGLGLVIMPARYPFLKAYRLAEELCANAKRFTQNAPEGQRPSSLDYLVLTSEVEGDLAALRRRTATAADGSLLTAKPFELGPGFLKDFLRRADEVLEGLPRVHTRGALDSCRRGHKEARPAYEKLRENLGRGLGGRHDLKSMSLERFDEIFPDVFFEASPGSGQKRTALADYLELRDYRPGAELPGE